MVTMCCVGGTTTLATRRAVILAGNRKFWKATAYALPKANIIGVHKVWKSVINSLIWKALPIGKIHHQFWTAFQMEDKCMGGGV